MSPSQRAQIALPPQPKIGPRNRRKNRVAGGVRSRLTLGLASVGLLLLLRRLLAVALPFQPHLLPSPHRGICSSLRRRGTPAAATPIAFPGGSFLESRNKLVLEAQSGGGTQRRRTHLRGRTDPNLAGGSGDGGAWRNETLGGTPRKQGDGMGWKQAGALPAAAWGLPCSSTERRLAHAP
jgi:hypothetical protein